MSVKLLAEGSSNKLENACRKYWKSLHFLRLIKKYLFFFDFRILCSAPDYDSKKWAVDGLAYLTLDADVKEILVDDVDALKTMYELTKVSSTSTFQA